MQGGGLRSDIVFYGKTKRKAFNLINQSVKVRVLTLEILFSISHENDAHRKPTEERSPILGRPT